MTTLNHSTSPFSVLLSESDNKLFVKVKNNTGLKCGVLKWNTVIDFPHIHGFSIASSKEKYQYNGERIKRGFDPQLSIEWFNIDEEKSFTYEMVDLLRSFEIELIEDVYIGLDNTHFSIIPETIKISSEPEFEEVEVTVNECVVSEDKVRTIYRQGQKKNTDFDRNRKNRNKTFNKTKPSNPHCPGALCWGGHYQEYTGYGGGVMACQYTYYPVKLSMVNSQYEIINKAFDILYSIRIVVADNSLFNKWFGIYTPEKGQLVLNNLRNIQHAGNGCSTFTISDINYGNSDVYASFYKNPSYNGTPCPEHHICNSMAVYNLFWRSPLKGWNSQFGVLVHELSHGYCNTKDHAYGITNCIKLAKTNPDLAVLNADSYEYFLEEFFGV